jgi:outer membrane protein TolC
MAANASLLRRIAAAVWTSVLVFAINIPAHGQTPVRLPFVPSALSQAIDVPPAVAAARAELARAAAHLAAAGAPPSWFLSTGASEVPDADFSKGNIRLELGRDFLTGGRRDAERALAEAELMRAAAELVGVTQRSDAALIRAASRALGWELIRRRRAAQDSLLATAEDALRLRFAAGGARYLDVLRLRTERLRATSALAAAQAEARGGEASLLAFARDAATRGRLADALSAVRDSAFLDGPLPSPPNTDSLAGTSIALVLAQADVLRAEAERARELAERSTQGTAFAGIQRIGQAADGPTMGPTVGITLSLPFLNPGATQRIREAADSGVRAAEARIATVEAAVVARLAMAGARFAGARERVGVYDAALLRGARSERDAALENYRAGTLSLLELLDFERALADAEAGRLESLLAAADAWADLLDAQTGGPSTATPE